MAKHTYRNIKQGTETMLLGFIGIGLAIMAIATALTFIAKLAL